MSSVQKLSLNVSNTIGFQIFFFLALILELNKIPNAGILGETKIDLYPFQYSLICLWSKKSLGTCFKSLGFLI